jgi:hypothetical protein
MYAHVQRYFIRSWPGNSRAYFDTDGEGFFDESNRFIILSNAFMSAFSSFSRASRSNASCFADFGEEAELDCFVATLKF